MNLLRFFKILKSLIEKAPAPHNDRYQRHFQPRAKAGVTSASIADVNSRQVQGICCRLPPLCAVAGY
jgi:hypothetical protein